MIYKFNNVEIDSQQYLLKVNRRVTSIEPQVFNLIVYLLQNKQDVVSRSDILDHVWNKKTVSDSSISNHIKLARKVLGDDGSKQQVIKTIHSRGYQFVASLDDSPGYKKHIKLLILPFMFMTVFGFTAFESENNGLVNQPKNVSVDGFGLTRTDIREMSSYTNKLSPKEGRLFDELNRAIGVILRENSDLLQKYPEGAEHAKNIKQLKKNMVTMLARSISRSAIKQHRCDLNLRNYVENSPLNQEQAEILGQLVSR